MVSMQVKNVVVLGGSGFVGSAVVAKLDAAGHSVTVLTRRRDAAKHLFYCRMLKWSPVMCLIKMP